MDRRPWPAVSAHARSDVLVENLVDAGEDTTALDRLVDLNPFAVEYRYQSLDSDDDPIDRDAFYQEVQTLFDHVASKIGV